MSAPDRQFDDPYQVPHDGPVSESFAAAIARKLGNIAVPPIWTEPFVSAVLEAEERRLREEIEELSEEPIDPLEFARRVERVTMILLKDDPPQKALRDAVERILIGYAKVGYQDFLATTATDSGETCCDLANRATARFVSGRHEEALADFDEAIKLAPMKPSLYSRRAELKITMGRLSEAKADLEAAVSLSDTLLDYEERLRLAEVHQQLGDHTEAAVELQLHLENVCRVADLPATEDDEPFRAVRYKNAVLNLDAIALLLSRWIALVRRLEDGIGRQEPLRAAVVAARDGLELWEI